MANESKYAVLTTLTFGWVKVVDDKAKIGSDPSKGIMADIEVPFKKPVFAVSSAAEASELFEATGADVFNSLLDYASDLKLRGAATTAKRNELTKDPIAEEAKSLVKTGMLNDAQSIKYIELRKGGTAKVAALVQATS